MAILPELKREKKKSVSLPMLRQLYPESKSSKLRVFLLAVLVSASFAESASAKQYRENNQYLLPLDSVISRGEFSILIPSSLPDTGLVSIVLFFDPQGNGDVPLFLYAGLAKKRNIVIAGSNRCKNNLEGDSGFVYGLEFYSRVLALFPGRKTRVHLAGFSGGAVLASYLSNGIPGIKGLLYTAAPNISIPSCPTIGFTGMADPNFFEMESVQERIPQSNPHCLRYWNGKHTWPPSESMAFAFDWIRASEMAGNSALEMVKKIRRKCATKMTAAQKEEILQTRCFLSSSLKIPGDDSLSLAVFRKSAEYKKYREESLKERKAGIEKKEFFMSESSQADVPHADSEVEKYLDE